MKEKIKEIILQAVKSNNGIKSIPLVLKVMEVLQPTGFTTDEYYEAYEELLASGEIISLEYTDPDNSLRVKSIHFDKRTGFLNLGDLIDEQSANQQRTNKADVVRASS